MKRLVTVGLLMLLAGCNGVDEAAKPVIPDMPRFETSDLIAGRSIWMGTCRNCHLTGVSGAPAVADYQAWQKRIEKGEQALHRSALDGIRDAAGEVRMPPRGGNDRLTDEQVKSAVDYMIASVRRLRKL